VFARFHGMPQHVSAALLVIDGGAALLLLVGLWTPLAGAVTACCELWIVVSGGGEFWLPLVLATLGATLAMIGPGAWSIDALLFGRKQIGPPAR
jgi:putative oxidoreductase